MLEQITNGSKNLQQTVNRFSELNYLDAASNTPDPNFPVVKTRENDELSMCF